LNHDQLEKFVAQATENPWCKLCIKRWITAGVQMPNGEIQTAVKGTPQGGVISPLLANLYLHKVFDSWMQKYFSQNTFERYADDVIIHCQTQQEAEQLLSAVSQRMQRYNLTLHPEKTKIVYCGRSKIARTIPQSFDFLGFTFRRRTARRKDGKLFPNFAPAISNKAKQAIVKTMREWNVRQLTLISIVTLSKKLNPQIRGWLNYYGKFYPSALHDIREAIEFRLYKWTKCKYPKKRSSRTQAFSWLKQIKQWRPNLFAHW
jgi:RNA-directed DNA polymerase